MADDITIKDGAGSDKAVATDDVSGVHYQRVKVVWGGNDTATQVQDSDNNRLPVKDTALIDRVGEVQSSPTANTVLDRLKALLTGIVLAGGNNNIGDVDVASLPALPTGSNVIGVVNPQGYFVTVSTDVTRPADTTAYAVNDALSDSTSAPTSGGFTFSNAARASGKSGIITDAIIASNNDPGTQLQGEIWIFNQAVTNINDNAAFAVSDGEIKTCIGRIPFTLEDVGNNGFYHAQNLNIGFTCVGSANLRFLIRVKNAYTPANAEVLTVALKIVQVD